MTNLDFWSHNLHMMINTSLNSLPLLYFKHMEIKAYWQLKIHHFISFSNFTNFRLQLHLNFFADSSSEFNIDKKF